MVTEADLMEFDAAIEGLIDNAPYLFLVFILLIVWSTVWKGIALWKSARLSQKRWFVALLVINTVGILEIIYIFLIARKKEQQSSLPQN